MSIIGTLLPVILIGVVLILFQHFSYEAIREDRKFFDEFNKKMRVDHEKWMKDFNEQFKK
jgi:hypothetical protein